MGAQHMAFFRGYLDGLPLDALARQYLNIEDDPRRTLTVLNWIRGELAAAARRTGDGTSARLFNIRPGTLNTPANTDATPSLEDFAALHDPTGFYSEAELLLEFENAFPKDRKSADARRSVRNDRLRKRLGDVLQRLERLLVVAPALDHDLAGWIDPAIARRLEHAGLLTVGDLISFMNAHGHRFYARLPRVGRVAADRLTAWLLANKESLGVDLTPLAIHSRREIAPVLAKQRPPARDVVPFEYLRPPAEIDGTYGRNRLPPDRCKIDAKNDYEAIRCWLALRRPESHTWRAYRKEAERLLLWALFAKNKALSDLTANDCAEYLSFLLAPWPAERWIGPRHVERWSPAWRPFAGPLMDSSRATANAILLSMFAWLEKQRYLDSNPMTGVPAIVPISESDDHGRSLTQAQWLYLLTFARTREASPVRAVFALLFAYGTGLRRAEIAAARVADLRSFARNEGMTDGWLLRVVGKRMRVRLVPMPTVVMNALSEYMESRGFGVSPSTWPPDASLLSPGASRRSSESLTPHAVSALYKAMFRRAADELRSTNPATAERLARASAHWMRHSHGSHSTAEGTNVTVVRENFGHVDIATTSRYITTERERRYEEVEAFLNKVLSNAR
ncbi:site-specific integrase [Pandoraea cepalis]|nr:site-specific integrase [Pandoraea cepalis]